MRHRTRLLLGALTAALILAAAVGTANGRRLEVSEQRILITWERANPLVFAGAGLEIRCPLTLLGSFHSKTISKVSGQLIGLIISATLPPIETECVRNGIENFRILQASLPWRILYISFRGTLPRIERVRVSLQGAGFLLTLGISCLYKTTEARPAFGEAEFNAEAGQATGFSPDPTVGIPLFEGSRLLCPESLRFSGRGHLHAGKTSRRISISLVQ